MTVGNLADYLICGGTEWAPEVARRVASSFAPFLVVDEGGRFYTFPTTTELLERLARDAPVAVALELDRRQVVRPRFANELRKALGPAFSAFESRGLSDAFVVVDDDGRAIGVAASYADGAAELFGSITAGADEVEPGQTVTFEVALDASAPLGHGIGLPLVFGAGETSLDLRATVSSASFAMPAETSWSHRFAVDRDLQPQRWSFEARAAGERDRYTLTVQFVARGQVVGVSTVTLRRKVAGRAPAPSEQTTQLRVLPRPEETVAVTLEVTHRGADAYQLAFYRGGGLLADETLRLDFQSTFAELGGVASRADLHGLGAGLSIELPRAIRELLEDPADSGKPMLIIAPAPVAPFELLQLRPGQGGPLLGVDRPVSRTFERAAPLDTDVPLRRLACIRPRYAGADALPSAEQEEALLAERQPDLRRVRSVAELTELLAATDVHAIHFAGHADGNPAQLALEGGRVRPRDVHPSEPLMAVGRPFMFLNGCHAGTGRVGSPAAQANLAKWFLAAGATGLVAPLIQIDSPTGLEAARTFYDAIDAGRTVGEAVQAVRARALTCPPGQVATFASYLAYGSPALRLT